MQDLRQRYLVLVVILGLFGCADEAASPVASMPDLDATMPEDARAPDIGVITDAVSAPDGEVTVDASRDALAADAGPWRSALYPEDWRPEANQPGEPFIHDFSYAGYKNGSALPMPNPDDTIVNVSDLGADPTGMVDSTPAFQGAIEQLSLANGGVVFVPEGHYRLDGQLRVTTSNITIRGEGAERSKLQFTRSEGMDYDAHLSFVGSIELGESMPLANNAGNQTRRLELERVDGLAVGDDILIGWTITEAFVENHGMNGVWGPFNDIWQAFFRREIVAIEDTNPPGIVVDVPLRYPALVRDGASLRKENGLLSDIAVEDLGLSNAVEWEAAWARQQVHVLKMAGVKDAWVRGVRSFTAPEDYRNRNADGADLQSSGILVEESKRVTITDTHLANAQNRGPGGNGYLFEIRRSNEVLTKDSTARSGRHNFIQNWGFGTTGCVWLRIHSADGQSFRSIDRGIAARGSSEFHHSLATANLIDSSHFDDGWSAVNRGGFSSGAGHSATQNVLWNTQGSGLLASFQYGLGYVIGTSTDLEVLTALPDLAGLATEPEDWTEGLGEGHRLQPSSLYEDQLSKRLNP